MTCVIAECDRFLTLIQSHIQARQRLCWCYDTTPSSRMRHTAIRSGSICRVQMAQRSFARPRSSFPVRPLRGSRACRRSSPQARSVERVKLRLVIVLVRMQIIEIRNALDIEHANFAIDNELAFPDLQRGLERPWKPLFESNLTSCRRARCDGWAVVFNFVAIGSVGTALMSAIGRPTVVADGASVSVPIFQCLGR
jgi:hypothetical protein